MASSALRKQASSAGNKKSGGHNSAIKAKAPNDFTESFFANVMDDDLAALSSGDRAAMAAGIWQLAQDRKTGTPKLRIYNPSPAANGWTVDHTVLEIVNDDMPFLVDSITGALQRRGLAVHLILHPVLQVERTGQGKLVGIVKTLSKLTPGSGSPDIAARTESFMHVQFDHCIDASLLTAIEKEVREVLAEVRATVEDWPAMRKRMTDAMDQAVASKRHEDAAENTEEVRAFMRWADDGNFIYLGYRDIDLVQENGKLVSIQILKNSGLGLLRNPETRMFGGLRDLGARQTPTLQMYVRQHHLLVITKSNVHSRVHRMVPLDAIFLRRFDADGNIIGERLFVGLFTSQSYSHSPQEIPFLRRKIEHVVARAGFRPNSHDGKALNHILNNYPHDELFQINEDELYGNALGILQLQERMRVAMFIRRDPFERFVTCLVYVPRDHYDSSLRYRFQDYLETAFGGQAEDWHVRIDDSQLARAFVAIRLTHAVAKPDLEKIESDLRDICRSWSDRLRVALAHEYGEAAALGLLRRYSEAFPAAYREAVDPLHALRDIQNLERSKDLKAGQLIIDLSPPNSSGLLHLKLFQANAPIALSEILPLIENTGLEIEYMGGPYEVRPRDAATLDAKPAALPIYIHEFVGKPAKASTVPFAQIKPAFEEAFGAIWSGEAENDGFNALMLRAGMSAREIMVLRSFARYLRQLRIPYSHEMITSTFVNHPDMAQRIYALFFARHNPELKGDRNRRCREIEAEIVEALGNVAVLEEDRIIRRYLNLVQASLRTNFFQTVNGASKTYLSIKFDSRAVEFMPLPKPLYEIFVYSTRTEAVHLRGGKVARGGIRWSDRRDDFRNEILGLMKAQMVKNSVIVPVGSKGGFIVKRPPAEADKFQAEGIECYRTMMRGLLDITDNRVGNKIVPPANVVRHDMDDPYLVVAADKGTAKFSDIANGISQDYKFWLDDAFASGGSAGYDHKEMGITARGAWEAVKRHFRELGKDIQTTDFTVAGVGDMSGDVFGNGMLLSEHIRLLSAFDHRHIFLDPNPDSASSFVERKRLFDLPRSSWADYNAKKISKGGGVFARSEKSIKLTPEVKKAFGITADSLAPNDLIQAILKSEVELVYFGGIGTYVKAADESHEDVGDRATEPVRIDGADLRCKVIGEGANLGMTQRGRIEYALKGGHLNTDAIDNSAGVDTSDHEVNIKILLRKLVDKGTLNLAARNKFLAGMTEDVGHLVLRDNYLQTQALSIAEARAAELLPQHVLTIHALEKTGLLNRIVEFLPDSREIAERQRAGKGLTRSELSVLLAYAKIWLYDELLASKLPDDASLANDLSHYFPRDLRKKYENEIGKHQMAREIIATVVTNSLVNYAGIHFVLAMADRTGRDAASITSAYLLAREAFGLRDCWKDIEALDAKVPAKAQTDMQLVIQDTLSDTVAWFLTQIEIPTDATPVKDAYSKGVLQLTQWLKKNPSDLTLRAKAKEAELVAQGVPVALAERVALLPVLATALDLTRMSTRTGQSIEQIAQLFFGLGHRLGLDWLAAQARMLAVQTPWQREAVSAVLGDLAAIQRRLIEGMVGKSSGKGKSASAEDRLSEWGAKQATRLERLDAMVNEARNAGPIDIALLTLAVRQLNKLI